MTKRNARNLAKGYPVYRVSAFVNPGLRDCGQVLESTNAFLRIRWHDPSLPDERYDLYASAALAELHYDKSRH